MNNHKELRSEIICTCQEMNAIGINQGTSGNVSVRNVEGFLITASGVRYDDMTPEQVVQMDLHGGFRGSTLPSSEWRMHTDIYRTRPDAHAIVHIHSPHASALSCLREDVPAFHYMIGVTGGASLRCAEYARFGTAALSEAMLVAIEGRNASLLANHGMICFAATLARTLALAVEIEMLCRQYILARQCGSPVILDRSEIEEVLRRFDAYGKQPEELAEDEVLAFEPPVRRDE
ncbi:MAG: class II aldolase/adducin family protein [Boseongicola sp.]